MSVPFNMPTLSTVQDENLDLKWRNTLWNLVNPAANYTTSGVITTTNTTNATSTTTGSIITAGGVGIAKALWVGGLANIAGVVTLQAQPILSTLTVSQAVFTDGSKGLVSNAITGSGSVMMGTSPSVTTSIVSASTTLAVFNTTATTVNAFGAASVALNIGHASGANTVLGATTFGQAGIFNGSLLVGTNLTLSNGSAGVIGGTAAGVTYYGNSDTSAYILFYGPSHATTPGRVLVIAPGGLDITGALRVTTTIAPGGYTVATLPAGVIGMKAYVTNAVAPANLTILVNGGAAYSGAQYNGANWVGD